ncbi:hypothetical protein [Demequina litorisediminis]|uniref:hypothetical protein n=1 Tax=Demequina litorisediminis TaxID=1849022 RepID=UPI0032AF9C71
MPADQSPTGKADTVIVVVSFEPAVTHDAIIRLDMEAIGLTSDARLVVDDALTDATYTWAREFYVKARPGSDHGAYRGGTHPVRHASAPHTTNGRR